MRRLGVAAMYFFWRWLKASEWPEAIIAGLTLGLSELCKFTMLIFYPLLPVLWGIYRLPERKAMTGRRCLREGAC